MTQTYPVAGVWSLFSGLFHSIRVRLVLAGGVVFLLSAAAAIYAVTRFIDSASSLHTVTSENVAVIDNAKKLDNALDTFARLVAALSRAETLPQYEDLYHELDTAWVDVHSFADAFSEEARINLGVEFKNNIVTLDKELLALDSKMLQLLEYRSAETRLFRELLAELEDIQNTIHLIKMRANFDLKSTFSDLLGAGEVSVDAVERVVNEDFLEFQFSLEIETTLTEIHSALIQLPTLSDKNEVRRVQEAFARNYDALRRKIVAIGKTAETADTLESLRRWGFGDASIFEQRIALIDLEWQLAEELALFIASLDNLEVESRRVSSIVVNIALIELTDIERAVEESVLATTGLLGLAFVGALIVGWRTVIAGIVTPLRRVENAMRRIAGGDTSVLLPPRTNDELGSMVGALATLRDYVVRVTEAERSLADKEAQLRSALENMSDGIIICDPLLNIRMINANVQKLFDYPEEMVGIGQNLMDGWYYQVQRGDFPESDLRVLNQMFRGGQVGSYERQGLDGKVLDLRIAPMNDGGAVCVISDITERKRAGDEIAEKEAQLRSALTNMPGGLCMCDSNQNVILFNDKLVELLEMPRGFVHHGMNIRDCWRDSFQSQGKSAAETDMQVNALVEMHRSGEQRACERSLPSGRTLDISVAPMESGGSVTVISDITAQRVAAEELDAARQESEKLLEQLRTSINAMPLGIVLRDHEFQAILWNRAFTRIMQITETDADQLRDLKSLLRNQFDRGNAPPNMKFPEWWTEIKLQLSKTISSKRPYFNERRWHSANRIIAVSTNPTPSGGLVTVYQDVTERRMAEEDLRENMAELERFNKLAVERELKMIELKKEVNILMTKSGKSDLYEIVH